MKRKFPYMLQVLLWQTGRPLSGQGASIDDEKHCSYHDSSLAQSSFYFYLANIAAFAQERVKLLSRFSQEL
jgi:hypothetical protein